MTLFPIFVKLAGRPALVVGGGPLAKSKLDPLLAADAVVTLVAPKIDAEILPQHSSQITWLQRAFEPADVEGKAIVFAATGVRDVDRAVFSACAQRNVLCNAIDDPEFCDFYSPAIVRRGDLQIAISTNGQSPALAQQIRQELETRFDPAWTQTIVDLGRRRREVLATVTPGPERLAILHHQARAALQGSRQGLVRRLARNVQIWLTTEDDKVALI